MEVGREPIPAVSGGSLKARAGGREGPGAVQEVGGAPAAKAALGLAARYQLRP